MIKFDYVSDLHIDHWDNTYRTFSLSGNKKHFPLDWGKLKKSDILVVAGDISDDLYTSIYYLKQLKNFYKDVIFVDGNHEHINNYPELFDQQKIAYELKNDPTVHYLPDQDFIRNGIAFVGFCGWWDYQYGKNIDQNGDYFKDWINWMDEDKTHLFAKNVLTRAGEEFMRMFKRLSSHQHNCNIKQIVLVSHTVPRAGFAREADVDHNSNFATIHKQRFPKISTWIFGHNHHKHSLKMDGIQFLSNPRGRPEDFDRVDYQVETCYL